MLYWRPRTLRRAGRPGADRDPRPADRRRDDGGQRRALQDDLLRHQRALRRRRGGPERDRGRLRFARQFRAAAVAVVPGRHRGRRPRLARRGVFGALFIEFVPNFADQLSVNFGESAKALPGAIYGALLILIMAVMPIGVAGALRPRRSSPANPMPGAPAGHGGRLKPSKKGSQREDRHDHQTHISAIRRRRRGSCDRGPARADNAPGVTDTEIKIGQTMPYSGPASAYGVIGRAEAAYFRMINEQGGVNGRKINSDQRRRRLQSAENGRADAPPRRAGGGRLHLRLARHPTNLAVRQYLNDNKIPQLFVAALADMFADPEHYPVDDRPEQRRTPDRGARLRQVHCRDQAERKDRRALPKRSGRQGSF